MKKTLLTSLLILLGFVLSYGQTAPSGTGTEADPYQIATLDNLVWMVKTDSIWADSAYFVQTANIDASATDTMVIAGFNPGWSPIGNVLTSFKGVYDGGGFTIDALTSHGYTANMALFGTVDGGITVKDLGLTNVAMTTGGSSGALLGYVTGEVVLENCYSTGMLEGQGTKVGGLVGTIEAGSNSSITGCYSEVNVTNLGESDYTMTGGFIGQLCGTGVVSKCYSTGAVVGNPNADAKLFTGGFIGLFDASGAEITKCYSTGNVTGSLIRNGFSPAGGFAGTAYHGSTITQCYATGDVINSGDNTGGFIGYTKYADVVVSNCYSLGNVTRTEASTQARYGSFCGRNRQGAHIVSSYSTGSVAFDGVDNPTGNGFIGDVTDATDTLCFFDKETSLQDSTSGSAVAKTTAEMQTETTFTDSSWDFTTIWEIAKNNYPNLQALPVTPEIELPEGKELIVNNYFDNGLANWDFFSLDTTYADYDLDETGVITGANSGHVTVHTTYNSYPSGRIQLSQHGLNGGIVEGGSYFISFKIKSTKSLGNCFWTVYKEPGFVDYEDWGWVTLKKDTVVTIVDTMVASATNSSVYLAIDFAALEENDVELWIDDVHMIEIEGTVGVSEKETLPVEFALEQNYPNPFNPTTVINFALPKASDVQLFVYNILGEKVTELVNGKMVAGNHSVNFNATNLASGMYIYRIKTGNFVSVKKMMLLK